MLVVLLGEFVSCTYCISLITSWKHDFPFNGYVCFLVM